MKRNRRGVICPPSWWNRLAQIGRILPLLIMAIGVGSKAQQAPSNPNRKAAATSPVPGIGSVTQQANPAGAGTRATVPPEVRVEFFGAEKGYTTGASDVELLCVLRNVGTTPLPANMLRVRCYALTGLDYTAGELTPLVPALEPKQAVSFRWRLSPNDEHTPLVASLLLTKAEENTSASPPQNASTGSVKAVVIGPHVAGNQNDAGGQASASLLVFTPQAVLAVVPHLSNSVPEVKGFAGPTATTDDAEGHVGNDHVALQIEMASGKMPIARMAVRDAVGWQTAAVAAPLISIRSAAEGQTPWWQAFHWSHSEAQGNRDAASLTLIGTCGEDWEAQISFETHRDTGALQGHLRLKARRTVRLYGIQLPRLTAATDSNRPLPAADGSAALIATEPVTEDNDRIVAAHHGMVTLGMSWPSQPPLPNWVLFPMPSGDPDHTLQLGAEWDGGEHGEVVLPGGIIDLSFRLFGLAPSDTVRDARRFLLP